MQVAIFTREGCTNCDSVKAMMEEMDVQYKEMDAKDFLKPGAAGYFENHQDWRTTGVVDALALLQMKNELPVVMINDVAHTYQEAVTALSKLTSKDILQFTQPAECEEGVCALAV